MIERMGTIYGTRSDGLRIDGVPNRSSRHRTHALNG